jgi:predicted PurR-regulated permease PerM
VLGNWHFFWLEFGSLVLGFLTAMPSPRNSSVAWHRIAPVLATFVTVVLAIACLYWARPVLIPLAVATLFTFMLGPGVNWLQRRGLPRTPSALIIVSLAAIVLGAGLWLVGTQLLQLLAELPEYQQNVAKRITEVREQGSGTLLRNVQRFVKEVSEAATGPLTSSTHAPVTSQSTTSQETSAPSEPVTVRVVERAAITTIAGFVHGFMPVAEPVFTLGLILVLVVYLLIFREDLRSRIVAVVGRGHLTLTTKAFDDAGRRISRYLIAQFVLNLSFGIVIGLGLLAIRIPHAMLWGFIAGTLRYIPYLGAWIACSLPIAMSLLVSESWLLPLEVIALFIVVEFFANLVVEPWLYGQSIGVSQAAWMIAIIFWTWLWGPVGLMLATPLTTCLVVLGKHVPGLKFFDILLGDEPVLTPDVIFYQRLLARDEDEAADLLQRHFQSLAPVELCDQVLVPALVHARRDLNAGLLNEEEYDYVLAAIHSLADQQDLAAAAVAWRSSHAAARQPSPDHALTVLACPIQDGADLTALRLFEQLLDPEQFNLEMVTGRQPLAELVQRAGRGPAVICIASLPSGGLSQTRHITKRLKYRIADQQIVVARWGARTLENREEWLSGGAETVTTTFQETLDYLRAVAKSDSHLHPPQAAGAERVELTVAHP